jgi:hypothetical protein
MTRPRGGIWKLIRSPTGELAFIVNATNRRIRSSFNNPTGPGQVAFDIPPGGTSASTTSDPDTLIFEDGTVVKVPDGNVVVVTGNDVLNEFDPSDLSFFSPISRLSDRVGL